MPKLKLVFGRIAASRHLDGASDERVEEEGIIVEHDFATDAELRAYIQGIEDMDGWEGYCEYSPAARDLEEN